MSVSSEIIKVLDALAEKFGIAIDWTSQNIIPYLEQLCDKYVNYEIATSVVWLIFGIVCLIFGKVLFKKMKYCFSKISYEDIDDIYTVLCVFAGVGCGIFVFIGFSVVMCQIFDIATCITFPEKIIFDELKSIYTSVK